MGAPCYSQDAHGLLQPRQRLVYGVLLTHASHLSAPKRGLTPTNGMLLPSDVPSHASHLPSAHARPVGGRTICAPAPFD